VQWAYPTWPTGQMFCVGEVLPAGQKYPAWQGPVQVLAVSPVLLPYLPPAHGPEQSTVD
jgi:hypothetical protein